MRPNSLLQCLRQRETTRSRPSAEVNAIRRFYAFLTPSTVVRISDSPGCHICKFTPSGRYLVCFSSLQHELLLFAHTGLESSGSGDVTADSQQLPADVASFGSFFHLVSRHTLVAAPHMLCKDFCLALQQETYLLVAAQSPPQSSRASPVGISAPTALPYIATTTFLLVRTSDGEVTDSLVLSGDFVHLSHNAGVAICGSQITILGLRSQTIWLMAVLPNGRFAPLTKLGRHLEPDDALALAQAAAAEERWRDANRQAASKVDSRVRALEQAAGNDASSAAERAASVVQPLPRDRRQSSGSLADMASRSGSVWAPPAARGQPGGLERRRTAVLGQLLHAPNALSASTELQAAVTQSGPDGSMITGLRQRLLTYLHRALQDEKSAKYLDAPGDEHQPDRGSSLAVPHTAAAGSQDRRQDLFIQHFESFASLVVWKVQFLNQQHLLLALGPPDGSALRHTDSQQQAAFLAVYSLHAKRFVAVLPNSSPSLLEAYLRHAGVFHAPTVVCTWDRFLTPGGTPAHARSAVERQMAHQYYTPQQVTRRILSAIPPTSQILCASPYLDASLFQYDEKLISPTLRPRSMAEVPLKFASRGRREVMRFKLSSSHFDVPPSSGRPLKQLVTWHFHPVLPFVLAVLQTATAPPQLLVYQRP